MFFLPRALPCASPGGGAGGGGAAFGRRSRILRRGGGRAGGVPGAARPEGEEGGAGRGAAATPHRASERASERRGLRGAMLWFQGAIPAAIASAKRSGAVFVVFVAGEWAAGPGGTERALLGCSGCSLASGPPGGRTRGAAGLGQPHPVARSARVRSAPIGTGEGRGRLCCLVPGLLRFFGRRAGAPLALFGPPP